MKATLVTDIQTGPPKDICSAGLYVIVIVLTVA